MAEQSEDIILLDSDRAASRKTVTGWVSRDGYFFGDDERTARYSGCTHRKCELCGDIIPKNRGKCDPCFTAGRTKQFMAMPREAWDGVTPLVIFDNDQFFFDASSLYDYCDDHDLKPNELQLVICDPQMASELDPDEIYQDIIPEDGDRYSLPAAILEAFDQLNKVIAATKEPVSWIQGRTAADLDLPIPTREGEANS